MSESCLGCPADLSDCSAFHQMEIIDSIDSCCQLVILSPTDSLLRVSIIMKSHTNTGGTLPICGYLGAMHRFTVYQT